jgi:hypothetical protein
MNIYKANGGRITSARALMLTTGMENNNCAVWGLQKEKIYIAAVIL